VRLCAAAACPVSSVYRLVEQGRNYRRWVLAMAKWRSSRPFGNSALAAAAHGVDKSGIHRVIDSDAQ
jgi:DNA-binding HxlR family transcriptional regulator